MSSNQTTAAPAKLVAAAAIAPGGTSTPELLVTEAEAAQLLRLSTRTLQRLRLEGGGPRFIKLTARRLAYAVSDLESWINTRVFSSTAAKTARGEAGE